MVIHVKNAGADAISSIQIYQLLFMGTIKNHRERR